jgi:hypothetical protein
MRTELLHCCLEARDESRKSGDGEERRDLTLFPLQQRTMDLDSQLTAEQVRKAHKRRQVPCVRSDHDSTTGSRVGLSG